MIQKTDLNQNGNLFTVAVILICGIGGLAITFGKVTLTSIACALILGIITNLIVSKKTNNAPELGEKSEEAEVQTEEVK